MVWRAARDCLMQIKRRGPEDTDTRPMSSPTSMRLRFLGAAGTVTGSRYLLESGAGSMLVDCGLFQGYKALRLRNWDKFPVAAATIGCVLLTHAHIDHSGYLPRLAKMGFRGRIHCTHATADLCRILLPDSGRLQEEEAQFANRRGFSKHKPALPLYTEDDARAVLEQLEPHPFDRAFAPAPGIEARFSPAGHILGAASVHVSWLGSSVLFSGDLGRSRDLVMNPPADPPPARYVVVESTYGDRLHEDGDPLGEVGAAITRATRRGGVVVVPAFAVGRAQTLMYIMHLLKARKLIPDIPVFLNSPMAANVTGTFRRHRGEHRLGDAECDAMCAAATVVNTVEQSKALNERRGPMIVISASGMATGGRVLHHLKAFAPDPRNLIMLAGFQAGGTRGGDLAQGATRIKIHGEYVPVRAEVVNIEMLSAHADYREVVGWLAKVKPAPVECFVTHGEPSSADALRKHIAETLGWRCRAPEHGEIVDLADAGAPRWT
jgi:metallo-beta-lactamase family protein